MTLPEPLQGDPSVLWTEDVLRFRDMDQNGHMNNGAIGELAESGRVRLIEGAFAGKLPRGAFFSVVRLVTEFKAELKFPGQASTGTWVSRVGGTSITISQAIYSDSGLVATAEAVCVLVDGDNRRPVRLPEAVRAAASLRSFDQVGPVRPATGEAIH